MLGVEKTMEYKKLQSMVVRDYAEHTGDEWKRLTKRNGLIEYLTTIHYLEKYLPKNRVVAYKAAALEDTLCGLRSTATTLCLSILLRRA